EEVPKAPARGAPTSGGAATVNGRAARKADAASKVASEAKSVPKHAWTVYADGACSGNPGPAGLGIVMVSPEGKMLEGYEYLGSATNNIAELTAILRAAELVPVGAEAVVHTD